MNESSNQENSDKGSASTLGVSESFLKILVCPIDQGRLSVTDRGLRCDSCQRVFPVENGIPNLVVEE